MASPSPKRARENNADNDQDSLSESVSPKRPRINRPNPSPSSLRGSLRLTSPMSSRTATTTITSSSSSPGSSDNGTGRDPARASDKNMKYPRRTLAHRQRNREPLQAGAQGEGDTTSSGESTSSESSSSEDSDDSDPDEGEEGEESPESGDNTVPHIPGQKPRIHRVERNPDLLARVSSFLPQMKDANDSLERDIAAGRGSDVRVDDVGDGDTHDGRYIEMNLGLGVLEEKRDDESSSSSDESDGDEARQDQAPSNVLGKLMGKKKDSTSKKPTIEEMKQ